MSDTGEDVATLFEDLGDLEKEFAKVELDARKFPLPRLINPIIYLSLCLFLRLRLTMNNSSTQGVRVEAIVLEAQGTT